ncbi:hypothetical protein BX661DRAFT_59274 [Kickxella alabastrina]|uniref:uncharacterized protein n=1 Tax=Kickxella alabastrina TaxID=61397 RepID=UPI0022210FE2|nr:uncharacterized protein BX661DRAFT_59274 [Kickxella alabastrina]KAI7822457.1 hypothetical protein BX661DRAFT_59274 [Kickxella alabastrina]
MTRHPSYALRKIIPPPSSETPIWKPGPPTALHRLICLITSHPVVLFARRNDCAHSQQIQRLLQSTSSTSHSTTVHPYRLVYLDDIPLGDMIQRRLQDLTGQWTVPHLLSRDRVSAGWRRPGRR